MEPKTGGQISGGIALIYLCLLSPGGADVFTSAPFQDDHHSFPTQIVQDSSELFQCPSVCFCNVLSRIVYCSRRNLDHIPVNISVASLQINLSGNKFSDVTLRRLNFSTFESLVHLYLSECGIKFLERNAFLDLKNLKWLDLSNNQLQSIPEGAFAGLRLQYLFLNGNKNIQIVQTSFDHLSTFGLYLHDCSLTGMDASVLRPLKNDLKFLWLNANQIKTLSEEFLPIFNGLDHVRLSSNPLHCNCNLLWLKKFFDERMDVFKGVPAPSCSSPSRVKLKSLDAMLPTEISCTAPTFGDVELSIKPGWGRLKCRARGDPPPTLYWIQPSGRTSKFAADERRSRESYHNEGTISLGDEGVDDRPTSGSGNHTVVERSDLIEGTYICVARNEAGNSTLSVNISMKLRATSDVRGRDAPAPSTTAGDIFRVFQEIDDFQEIQQVLAVPGSASNSRRTHQGGERSRPADPQERGEGYRLDDESSMFSSYELSCAVFLTHLLTLVICIFIISKIYRCRVKPGNSLEKPAAFGFATGMTYPDMEGGKKDLHVNQHGRHFLSYTWNNGVS